MRSGCARNVAVALHRRAHLIEHHDELLRVGLERRELAHEPLDPLAHPLVVPDAKPRRPHRSADYTESGLPAASSRSRAPIARVAHPKAIARRCRRARAPGEPEREARAGGVNRVGEARKSALVRLLRNLSRNARARRSSAHHVQPTMTTVECQHRALGGAPPTCGTLRRRGRRARVEARSDVSRHGGTGMHCALCAVGTHAQMEEAQHDVGEQSRPRRVRHFIRVYRDADDHARREERVVKLVPAVRTTCSRNAAMPQCAAQPPAARRAHRCAALQRPFADPAAFARIAGQSSPPHVPAARAAALRTRPLSTALRSRTRHASPAS